MTTSNIPALTGYRNALILSEDFLRCRSGIHFLHALLNTSNWTSHGRTWTNVRFLENQSFCSRLIAVARLAWVVFSRATFSSHYDNDRDGSLVINLLTPLVPQPQVHYDMLLLGRLGMTALTDQRAIVRILMENRNSDVSRFCGGNAFDASKRLMGPQQLFAIKNEAQVCLRTFFLPHLSPEALKGNTNLGRQMNALSLEVIHKLDGHVSDLGKILLELPSKVIQSLLFGRVVEGVKEAFWDLLPLMHRDLFAAIPRYWPTDASVKKRPSYVLLQQLAQAVWTTPENYPGILSAMKSALDAKGAPLFTSEHLFSSMMLFLLAGEDTLVSALSSSLYALAKNPDKQEELYRHLAPYFSRALNIDELDQIPYLEWVIREVLRLFPPIPVQVRELNPKRSNPSEPVTVIGTREQPYCCPVGRQIVLPICAVQRNESVWKHATQFIPERHDPLRSEAFCTPKELFPFSVGPNSCLGKHLARLELKVFLFNAMKSGLLFRSDQVVEFDIGVSLRTLQPMTMDFSRRPGATF